MYFNQLAREIGIGQQAILRHMEALENGGLIKTYAEKSDLGAPDRKYYQKEDIDFSIWQRRTMNPHSYWAKTSKNTLYLCWF